MLIFRPENQRLHVDVHRWLPSRLGHLSAVVSSK